MTQHPTDGISLTNHEQQRVHRDQRSLQHKNTHRRPTRTRRKKYTPVLTVTHDTNANNATCSIPGAGGVSQSGVQKGIDEVAPRLIGQHHAVLEHAGGAQLGQAGMRGARRGTGEVPVVSQIQGAVSIVAHGGYAVHAWLTTCQTMRTAQILQVRGS
jgi:hypothetical protein